MAGFFTGCAPLMTSPVTPLRDTKSPSLSTTPFCGDEGRQQGSEQMQQQVSDRTKARCDNS
jgi:hypothetical protein